MLESTSVAVKDAHAQQTNPANTHTDDDIFSNLINQLRQKPSSDNHTADQQLHATSHEMLTREIEAQRRLVLEEFGGRNLEGLRIQQIETFFREKQLPIKPYISIRKEDVPLLQMRLPYAYLENMQEDEPGFYLPNYDLVIIFRDQKLEQVYGTVFSESYLAHELGHAATESSKGFANDIYNPFLEEGFADLLRGEYMAHFAPGNFHMFLEKALNSTFNSINDTVTFPNSQLTVLLKYIVFDAKGQPRLYPSSLAAMSLEMLIQINPEIKSLLLSARFSQDSFEQLRQTIDTISPNLFQLISQGSHNRIYSREEFEKKYRYIRSIYEAKATVMA